MDERDNFLKPKEKSDVQFNGEGKYSINWTKPYMVVAEKEFDDRFKKLKEQYDELVDEIHLNNLIYTSDIKFEPVIGKTYYLYKNERYFLSMIAPWEWKQNFVVAVKFNFNGKWEKSII